jgi:hypothetical protein
MQASLRFMLPLLVACGGSSPSDPDARDVDAPKVDAPDLDARDIDAQQNCPTGGAVEVLGTGGRPAWVAVDATHVYWVTEGDPSNGYAGGVVMRNAKTGGTPTTLAMNETKPVDIVVDDTNVYWIRATAGTIMKMPKAGGTPTLVANAPDARRLALDDTHLYWTRNGSGIGGVSRISLGGGSVEALESAILGTHQLALDASAVYFTSSTAIQKVSKAGGTSTTVSGTMGLPDGVLLQGSTLFFLDDSSGGSVKSVPKSGGTATTITTNDQPTGFAVDATHVYWNADAKRIVRTPHGGGTPEILADNELNPAELALDDCYVYWVDRQTLVGSSLDGKVARRTKN